MKLCVAQTRPVKGDVPANIERHVALIELARGADVILFPELSLTGYEPTLARELAIEPDDGRLDVFQAISDSSGVTLGVGAPTRSTSGARITLFLFQPRKPRLTYSKRYLHPDEEPFFVAGQQAMTLSVGRAVIAPAICYELSVPEHSESAARNGASVYMASVAKTAKGLDAAIPTLAGIARRYSMTVLMANSVGECDGCECAGKTSIWNDDASLMGQLNDRDEGILTIDTDTAEVAGRTTVSRLSVGQLESLVARADARAWREVAELIRAAGGYRWVGLYLVTDTEIRAVTWTGPAAPAFPRFPRDTGLNGVAVDTRAPVICQDVSTDSRYLTAFSSTGSEAVFPVLSEAGHVVGTIDVESDRPNAFTPDDERFLAHCAVTASPLWKTVPPRAGSPPP